MKKKKKMKKKLKIRKKEVKFGIKRKIMLLTFGIIVLTIILLNINNIERKITGFAINQPDSGSFNLKVEIPDSYKNIVLGKPVVFTARILNLANDNRVDITLKYYAIDSKQNVIFTKSETLAVETQASFVREVKLPQETPTGDYTIKAEIIYNDNKEAESQDSFKIIKNNRSNIEILIIVVIIVTVILFILIFFLSKIRRFIEKIELKSKIGKIVKKKMVKDIR